VHVSLAVWSLIVAGISVAIALAGFVVNAAAIRGEQSDRKQAIGDAWAREWAAQRPVVYPLAGDKLVGTRLPLKNGGKGPALNVAVDLEYDNKGKLESLGRITAGNIAAGDVENAVSGLGLMPAWHLISGQITCTDLAGGRYTTPFKFAQGPRGELELTVGEQLHTTA